MHACLHARTQTHMGECANTSSAQLRELNSRFSLSLRLWLANYVGIYAVSLLRSNPAREIGSGA